MKTLLFELRNALRSLRRGWTNALLGIILLAVGSGSALAMYVVINAAILTPPPFEEPDQIFVLWERTPQIDVMSVSFPDFEDWRSGSRVFEDMAAQRRVDVTLAGVERPIRLQAIQATHNLVDVLRVRPLLGRFFSASEDRPGGDAVVVLSESVWSDHFGRRPSVLGEAVILNGEPFTIIGVVQNRLGLPGRNALWLPIRRLASTPEMVNRGNHPGIFVIGRTRPGLEQTAIRRELDSLSGELAARHMETNRDTRAEAVTLAEFTTRGVRPALMALGGGALGLLLITCCSLGGLLLVRSRSRRREFDIRASMGGSRRRLALQLILEHGLLAAMGTVGGCVSGFALVDAVIRVFPDALPADVRPELNGGIIAALVSVSLLTTLLAGVVPALSGASGHHARARSHTPGRSDRRFQSALVIAEIAVALVLMTGAGLLVRSAAHVLQADLGFDPGGVMVYRISLTGPSHSTLEARTRLADALMERLQASPFVRGAGITTNLPIDDGEQTSVFPAGRPPADMNQRPLVEYAAVTPDYFQVLGIPLLAGRTFDSSDGPGRPRTIVVDRAFAERFWPGLNPVGQQIVRGREENDLTRYTVVGVVGDVRYRGPERPSPYPQMYYSHRQVFEPELALVVQFHQMPGNAVRFMKDEVFAVDSALAVELAGGLSQIVDRSTANRRLGAALLSMFALTALLLAAGGVFALVSRSVQTRQREMAVRLALGAPASWLAVSVVRYSLGLAVAGVSVGLLGALALTRYLDAVVVGVSSLDPTTYAAVIATMLTVSLVASLWPALQTTRTNVVESLRKD